MGGKVSDGGISKAEVFSVIGFNPKRLYWETIVRHGLIPQVVVEEKPVSQSKDHAAVVNECLPDLHTHQIRDHSVSLRGSLSV